MASHCDYVAGFGEVCTHVATLLFALEYAGMQCDAEKSVTDVLAYWIGPRTKREGFRKKLSDIDFGHPKKILEGELEQSEAESESEEGEVLELTRQEVDSFFKNIQKCGSRFCSVCSVKE